MVLLVKKFNITLKAIFKLCELFLKICNIKLLRLDNCMLIFYLTDFIA